MFCTCSLTYTWADTQGLQAAFLKYDIGTHLIADKHSSGREYVDKCVTSMPAKPVSDYIQHLQDNASHTLQKVVLMSCYNHIKESCDCRQHLKDESQAPSAA